MNTQKSLFWADVSFIEIAQMTQIIGSGLG